MPPRQQYQKVLRAQVMQPHGGDSFIGTTELMERINGIDASMQAIVVVRGHLIGPMDLSPDDFAEVIKSWYANGISGKEFASRAKVAAWLFDLVISDFDSPYPSRRDCS
jgi:hypothetical protein